MDVRDPAKPIMKAAMIDLLNVINDLRRQVSGGRTVYLDKDSGLFQSYKALWEKTKLFNLTDPSDL